MRSNYGLFCVQQTAATAPVYTIIGSEVDPYGQIIRQTALSSHFSIATLREFRLLDVKSPRLSWRYA